ncbi:MAG: DeoR/GlpR family DNA-binding transcription regulator [Sneathiellales bacterium]|nr:DeoR/GlpR family DNA-binding transcription regulator [Sneathiellales bacterium]
MGARKDTRLSKLREEITKRASLHLSDAADLLQVSEMTIRRDIRENPDDFSYLGGHIVLPNKLQGQSNYSLHRASQSHWAEKREACKHCLPYLENTKTIYVDCGTTLEQLLELIPEDLELTIVCSSLNIADLTIRKPNLKLFVVGGFYDTTTSSFSGMDTQAIFKDLVIGSGFFTAAGLDNELGATCTAVQEVPQKRAAMANSRKRILVIDKSKIGKIHTARFGQINDFDLILTEDGPLTL